MAFDWIIDVPDRWGRDAVEHVPSEAWRLGTVRGGSLVEYCVAGFTSFRIAENGRLRDRTIAHTGGICISESWL